MNKLLVLFLSLVVLSVVIYGNALENSGVTRKLLSTSTKAEEIYVQEKSKIQQIYKEEENLANKSPDEIAAYVVNIRHSMEWVESNMKNDDAETDYMDNYAWMPLESKLRGILQAALKAQKEAKKLQLEQKKKAQAIMLAKDNLQETEQKERSQIEDDSQIEMKKLHENFLKDQQKLNEEAKAKAIMKAKDDLEDAEKKERLKIEEESQGELQKLHDNFLGEKQNLEAEAAKAAIISAKEQISEPNSEDSADSDDGKSTPTTAPTPAPTTAPTPAPTANIGSAHSAGVSSADSSIGSGSSGLSSRAEEAERKHYRNQDAGRETRKVPV